MKDLTLGDLARSRACLGDQGFCPWYRLLSKADKARIEKAKTKFDDMIGHGKPLIDELRHRMNLAADAAELK